MNGELGETLKSSPQHPQTAETILWDLPREQRKDVYSGLCDFIRWILKRQDHRKLEQFEKDLADHENFLKEKVDAGEVSADEANEAKGYRIWLIAHEESKHAPSMIALWDAPLMSIDTAEFEKNLAERKNLIEGEFKEKLQQCLHIGEV